MDVSLVVADRKVGDSEADQAAERLARTPGFRLVETRLVPVQHHRAKPFRYNLLSVSDRLDCFLPRSTIAVHGPMGDAQRALNEALEKVAYDPTRCGVILLGGSRASASGGLLPCAIHTEIDGIRGALERALRTERASEVRPLRVITTRRTAERWEVDLHHRTGTPPLVFFSRQWLPDLRARNGEGSALDVYVAAGGLVAVAAPAKTTRIELFYHEPTLDRICKWIGGSAWAVASWALLVPLL